MGKKAWIIYILVTIVIFAIGAVGMLVLVPQLNSYSELPESYVGINKEEFKFDSSKNQETYTKEYTITASDVNKGLKQDKFEEGNINPFTPNEELTIYNEPTLENGSNLGPLTPNDK